MPQARSLCFGECLGVKCTLDYWQQGELGGHVTGFELLNNMEEIFSASLKHSVEVLWVSSNPALVLLHEW